MADLGGPVPGLVGRMGKAMGDVGNGNIGSAGTELLPSGLRNSAMWVGNAAKYGESDIRDSNGNLVLKPNNLQRVMYAVGFNPTEVRQYRQAKQLLTTHDRIANDVRARELDKVIAAMRQGDYSAAQSYALEQEMSTGTVTAQEVLRDIAARFVEQEEVKDLGASGGLNAKSRNEILQSFPANTNPTRSEVQRLMRKYQIMQQMGVMSMPSGNEMAKAQMVDQLVGLGETRASALEQTERWARL